MTPQERKEFNDLKAQVRELTGWKKQKERQQLKAPLDVQSIAVLEESMRDAQLERINVRDIFFKPTQDSPVEQGQMRFFDDGSTQTFRATTTKGVFTGSIDLTAV
jgi:hypothetical protein